MMFTCPVNSHRKAFNDFTQKTRISVKNTNYSSICKEKKHTILKIPSIYNLRLYIYTIPIWLYIDNTKVKTSIVQIHDIKSF